MGWAEEGRRAVGGDRILGKHARVNVGGDRYRLVRDSERTRKESCQRKEGRKDHQCLVIPKGPVR